MYVRLEHRAHLYLQHVDVWCTLNPTAKDYTFYSAVHSSYSCIDYIFASHVALSWSPLATIESRIWSDHFPACTSFLTPNSTKHRATWCLNKTLLRDPVVQA